MRVSVVQMNPSADKAANLAAAERLVSAAVAEDRPDLVVLPEMWTCLGGDGDTKRAAAERLPDPPGATSGGEAYRLLRDLARRHRIVLHGGSMAEDGGERLYNTTVVFGPDGEERARYRKIHLFDIVAPDGTGYRESATFGRGSGIVTYRAGDTTVGCTICYDLRFPELYLALRRAGAELIVVPAAFTLQTGKDHWEVLLRARAIETQCWIAAAATWGRHQERNETRFTYGHSLIADPWGHVVAKASDGEGWATARLDHRLTARVRRDMPLMDHRVLA
ncbi:MAG: carbon-nitrogen hydrolase family protein [Elioraea sp.]|nr:carbon-nitrogen hydrolase family protein [Elioraea sp.]